MSHFLPSDAKYAPGTLAFSAKAFPGLTALRDPEPAA